MDILEKVYPIRPMEKKEDNGAGRTFWKVEQERHPGKSTQDTLNLTLLSVMSQETRKPSESEHPMKNARAAMTGDVFANNNHELF